MGDNYEPCVKFYVNTPYEHKGERMAKKIKDSFHYFKLFITFQGHAIKTLNNIEVANDAILTPVMQHCIDVLLIMSCTTRSYAKKPYLFQIAYERVQELI